MQCVLFVIFLFFIRKSNAFTMHLGLLAVGLWQCQPLLIAAEARTSWTSRQCQSEHPPIRRAPNTGTALLPLIPSGTISLWSSSTVTAIKCNKWIAFGTMSILYNIPIVATIMN